MRGPLGHELHEARSAIGLSLEAASRAAKISQGYLHKLEAGRVENPSPRVLRRLSEGLGISYRRLMELADYLMPDELPAGQLVHSSLKEEVEVAAKTEAKAEGPPTNQELARLLEAVLRELTEVRRGQDELVRALKPG